MIKCNFCSRPVREDMVCEYCSSKFVVKGNKMTEYEKLIHDFVECELEDYSFYAGYEVEEYDFLNGEHFYHIRIKSDMGMDFNIIHFKVADGILYVDINEDSWEKIEEYDYSVKYFWIALLDFPECEVKK